MHLIVWRAGCARRNRLGAVRHVDRLALARELLQPLLLGDAEMLLLIDDQQPQAVEGDGLAEQRMGADDDVDLTRPEAGTDGRRRFGGRQPR